MSDYANQMAAQNRKGPLEPCPTCGALRPTPAAPPVQGEGRPLELHHVAPESGLRECAHCGSVGPHKPREVCRGDWSVECSCGMETKLYPTPQQAAEVWNTRAPSSVQGVTTVGEAT